jgi:pantoate--beta-alanine ligase
VTVVPPALASTREELHRLLSGRTGRVAFVPTMGALHAGHASLMARARQEVGPDGTVVVSIFVNPLQFGAGEDLDRYPRTLDADLGVCAEQGVDVVFAPAVEEVYPGGEPQVTVEPGPLAAILEGRSRPTHFRGVLTVVAKLFGLVRPDVAVFGEKDYQQLVLIRRMVADLCMGIDVVGAETLREPDGLAMSSRNRYLDAEDRLEALTLSRTLHAGREAQAQGATGVVASARAELRRSHRVDLDYLELTGPDLGPAPEQGAARLLIAARVGKTRLIDNVAVHLGGTERKS